ncbi:hypothetical protein [Pedobacter paludis]|uniref:Uncharacterized protein n=1 Tax=Pedobacter paludis TaxID=2203212 RepID=A0A317EXR9_9SPHI|nr:hypothetical protein [Pedobacter paludis]PWS31621.1 hypothetical protein DF947_13615 [Pedobacter paludis]
MLKKEQLRTQIFLKAFEKFGRHYKEIIKWSMNGEAQVKVPETLGINYGFMQIEIGVYGKPCKKGAGKIILGNDRR